MLKKWIVLAALCAGIPAFAGPFGYTINIDTSAVSGTTGSVFFVFGPGDTPFDPATATISNFTGGLPGPGTLPSPVVLDNTVPPSDFFQQDFTFGSFIHFVLTFDGPALNSPSPAATGGSDFGLYLLDSLNTPLLTDEETGLVFRASIEARTGAVSDAVFPFDGGPSVVTADSPEPATLLLLSAGLATLALTRKRLWGSL